MKRIFIIIASLSMFLSVYANEPIKNVIFIIGDGMGLNQVCTLESPNHFERAEYIGLSKTYSASHKVTDSAAGGTALACGMKTKNGMLGLTPDSLPQNSVLTILQEKGFSTGIVASCRINHATPASYYAHQPNRNMDAEILSDLYKNGPDVFVAGGNKLLSIDSLQNAGYTYVNSIADLQKQEKGKIACVLAPEDMPAAPERGNDIVLGTAEAIRLLEKNPKGFFLMIEGSQIDWAGHGNNAEYMKAEVEDINKVIGLCMDYADNNPGTLVIITADHETGGTTVVGEEKEYKYSTGNHTGVMVPVYSYGSGSENFSGIFENTSFKDKILNLTDKKVKK
ncbi:MAG: alkaline phosphatase [Paludibacteraceae bacterium]|nr:alkaline phosphatase [Paludibacteraceae bacterium]MBR3871714.1 alkaline phosphatase [Paludibacteraceae bacterium]